VDKPKGIAIPMDLVICAKEDLDSVLWKLRSREDEITLGLAPDWDLGEGIDSFLKKQSN
jgi:hypothetical protein